MTDDVILREMTGPVAVLTLNRPEARYSPALSIALCSELR